MMRISTTFPVRGAFVLLLMSSPARSGEVPFAEHPAVTKNGESVRIAFTLAAPGDVEVAILGKDGAIVRHLAAGVLNGKNPPPDPLKPGLSQVLEWDGKTDAGEPAGAGPFKVRVRTGMGVKFDGFFGEDCNFMAFPRGLATDSGGNLYVYSASVGNRSADGAPNLQVFDRSGRYLRTLMPMPANLPAASVKPFGAAVRGDGDFTPANFMSTWPVFYSGLNKPHIMTSTIPANGALLFATRTTIARIGTDGGAMGGWFTRDAWPKNQQPSENAVNWRMNSPGGISVSPDGKTAYVSGVFIREGPDKDGFPPTRVYRIEVESGKLDKFADIAGAAVLAGSCLDRDGNLLVCDTAAGRVSVLDPKGAVIGELKAPQAAAVAVHRTSGAVYVLCYQTTTEYSAPKALLKFSGWKDAREEGRIALRKEGGLAAMALDDSSDPAVVWVATSCTKGGNPYLLNQAAVIMRLEERGGAFKETPHEIKFPATNACLPVRMAVHPDDDKVLCRGEYTSVDGYEGLTGRPLALPFKNCLDMGVGLDGNWYLQPTLEWQATIQKFDRNFKPAANASGSNKAGFAFGRYGQGLGSFGISANAKGRVFSLQGLNEQVISGLGVVVFSADGKPEDHGRLKGADEIAKHHKQFESTIVAGLGPCGSIAVDWKDNIYVGVRGYPADWKPAAGFENDAAHWQCSGSVMKFKPEGGEVLNLGGPEARPPSAAKPVPPGKQGQTLWLRNCYPCGPIFFENAAKVYTGLGSMGCSFGSGCSCRQPMFQLDGWGRLFIPNALDCSVQVVDNEGNEILRFGQYGNADSRGSGSESALKKPEIPLGWPEAVGASHKAIYIADVANRRIVRVLKTYSAEETCAIK